MCWCCCLQVGASRSDLDSATALSEPPDSSQLHQFPLCMQIAKSINATGLTGTGGFGGNASGMNALYPPGCLTYLPARVEDVWSFIIGIHRFCATM